MWFRQPVVGAGMEPAAAASRFDSVQRWKVGNPTGNKLVIIQRYGRCVVAKKTGQCAFGYT